MKLHTVIVSYNRQHLTEQAITSYLDTVTVPHTLTVVDNGSDKETQEWLMFNGLHHEVLLLGKNFYPGYATNRGFELAPREATHLQRADNDFRFLPGWCEQVADTFGENVGQVGLRTDEEEEFCQWNVGGNMIIRRELWDAGLRYDERPWREYPAGISEDSHMGPAVQALGYQWRRVRRSCIVNLATGDWADPYYQKSYGDRGIGPKPLRRLKPRRGVRRAG